jgi:RNA polymerase sigma factor (sigma-70 family)
MDDAALLAAFARDKSEEAFQELVRRHVGVVYSVCLRQLRDAHWAEDVTQAVFILLARKAGELPTHVVVGGWLYKAAFYACSNARDLQRTRVYHEKRVMPMANANEQDPVERAEMENLLDAGLMELNKAQREVLVLRFFENKSLQEVARIRGQTLYGTQKALDSGLAKLRRFLAQRGVSVTAAIIVAVMMEQSLKAVPAGLAANVGATALGGSSAVPAHVAALVGRMAHFGGRAKFMAMFAGMAACVLLGLAGLAFGGNLLQGTRTPVTPVRSGALAMAPRAEDVEALWGTLKHAELALRRMDLPALEEVVTFPDAQQLRHWEAMARVFRADFALKEAAVARFGPEGRQITTIKTFAQRLDEVLPQVDAARMWWEVGDRKASLHFVYRNGAAAGGAIVLVKIGSQWKIDAAQTMDVEVEGLNADGKRVAAEGLDEIEQTRLWEKLGMLESSFSRVKEHIEGEQLRSLTDARADLQSTQGTTERVFFRLALRLNEQEEPRFAVSGEMGRTIP